MQDCRTCEFAEWERTKKLHKIKKYAMGACLWKVILPQLPAMLRWNGDPLDQQGMIYAEWAFEDWDGCDFWSSGKEETIESILKDAVDKANQRK